MQQQLADLEHQMKMEAETQRAQHELQLETVRRDCEHQITKLQDELLRLETAKQNALALSEYLVSNGTLEHLRWTVEGPVIHRNKNRISDDVEISHFDINLVLTILCNSVEL